MVVRIRLARHGTRNNPFYHIVAIADHKPRDARPIEKLGEYDPVPRPRVFRVPQMNPDAPVLSSGLPAQQDLSRLEKRLEWNSERIKYWLTKGAQPSKPLAKMLDKANLIPEGQFFKGMYRAPTQQGISELDERAKQSSTEIRAEIKRKERAAADAIRQALADAKKKQEEAQLRAKQAKEGSKKTQQQQQQQGATPTPSTSTSPPPPSSIQPPAPPAKSKSSDKQRRFQRVV